MTQNSAHAVPFVVSSNPWCHDVRGLAYTIHPRMLTKSPVGARALCPDCGESYPLKHGPSCRACQGQTPYIGHPKGEAH